jgi:hypoxanthine phosphoribosyltransferase
MATNPYDYENRQGLKPISWTDFYGLCKGLVQAVAPWQPEMVLAVSRGGYYPGTLIAHILRIEVYPVRLSRRVQDVVAYQQPQWSIWPPETVAGKRVLVVDEISSTGETLQIVKAESEQRGASEVRTAVLYAHSRGVDVPDYIGMISDGLILNPWDREIYADGCFQIHPEYAGALREQGLEPGDSFLIEAAVIQSVKKPSA